jgi:hypothetical protein
MKLGWFLFLEPLQGHNVGNIRSDESIPTEGELAMESGAKFVEPCINLQIELSNGQITLDKTHL